MKPVSSSRVRDSTSGPAGATFEAATSASTALARKAFSISASTASRSRCSMSARSSLERVELACRAGELVVELRQHLLADLLDRDVDVRGRLVRELVGDALGLARGGADERRLDLLDEPAGAELDDRVALRLALGRDDVDDEGVALLRGPVAGGHELGDGLAQRLELLGDELLRHLGLGLADLELGPVDDVDLRLHGHGRGELPVRLVIGRELVVVLRLRDGPDARARGRVPEPAADVAVDRLGHDPLLAEPLGEDRHRHLALPEAGDLHRLRQVGGGVLDRVVDVVRRHVDLQADRVAAELLDLRRHWTIQAEAARAESSSPASAATRCSISSRSSRTRSSDCPAGSSSPQST